MAERLTSGAVEILTLSTTELNRALAQLVEWIDELRGLRGQITVQSSLTLAGGATAETDAARLQDVVTRADDPFYWLLRGT